MAKIEVKKALSSAKTVAFELLYVELIKAWTKDYRGSQKRERKVRDLDQLTY